MTKEETLTYLKAYLDGDTAIGNIIPLRSVLESALEYLEPSLPSNQAEKDTIERAIQWLIAHADDYIVDMEVSRYKPSKLHVGGMCWEHLKKAMEGKE